MSGCNTPVVSGYHKTILLIIDPAAAPPVAVYTLHGSALTTLALLYSQGCPQTTAKLTLTINIT